MSYKWLPALSICSAITLLTGCGLYGPEQKASSPIDPPQMTQSKPLGPSKEVTSDTVDSEINTETSATTVTDSFMATVFLKDPDGYVVPLSLSLPKMEGTGSAKQVLSYMVKGGPIENVKPKGFEALLPEGTKVNGMTIKEGIATVDFSPAFKKYEAADERKIVEAVTYALTSFPTVKEVDIQINGYPQETMPIAGTPVQTLTRESGINLELAEHAKVGDTTPLTLYFQGETADHFTYYVPITRLVPRTNDKATATVAELIKGPKHDSHLFSAILPTTKLLNVRVEKDTTVVDFDEKILSYSDGKASPQALESVLLSVTENTGTNQLQVLVKGKSNITAGDKDYSKPVTRPIRVNMPKF